MTLSPQFLDELRARTLLSALVGKTTKLTKAGREFKGCCPFHNEKTPSFYVNDDKAFYHCFGCGAHGDAIRWMTDQRGLPFIDAVRELAQAAGLEMPAPDPRAAERAERAKGLHEACADAADWFVQQMNGIDGAEARRLLERRGIRAETARAFGLGYAPDSRGKLKSALKEYGDPLLVEAGLLIAVEGKDSYDRFRGRLMIPIRDPRGRVIAFGGRVIGEGEPKYLNSPETPLFDKGRTLYNLDRAAPASRKAGRVLVVEGYMDVIALAQAGFEEAVAPLGTALTEGQLERLWRLSDVPILCFDGDAAGQKAAIRAAARALPMLAPGRSLAFVTLPFGKDPDDIIKEQGSSGFEQCLLNARDIFDTIWHAEVEAANVETPSGRAGLRQRLEELSAGITDSLVRQQIRSALIGRFYDTFGWKRTDVAKIREAAAAASRVKRPPPSFSLLRAVLLGLMRHTSVLVSEYEEVFKLEMGFEKLAKWRDYMVNAALGNPGLDENLIEDILSRSDISPLEERNYQKDLAFSFYRTDSDPNEACSDLRHVIAVLNGEKEMQANLDAAYDRFVKSQTDEDFEEYKRLLDVAAEFKQAAMDFALRAQEAA